jgi:hypothetical protein
MSPRADPGAVGRLCPGGRCAAVLDAFARWREEKRVEWSKEAGRQMAVVFKTAAADAGLSFEDERRLTDAFAGRMQRIAEGDSDWLTGEGGETWVGPAVDGGRRESG